MLWGPVFGICKGSGWSVLVALIPLLFTRAVSNHLLFSYSKTTLTIWPGSCGFPFELLGFFWLSFRPWKSSAHPSESRRLAADTMCSCWPSIRQWSKVGSDFSGKIWFASTVYWLSWLPWLSWLSWLSAKLACKLSNPALMARIQESKMQIGTTITALESANGLPPVLYNLLANVNNAISSHVSCGQLFLVATAAKTPAINKCHVPAPARCGKCGRSPRWTGQWFCTLAIGNGASIAKKMMVNWSAINWSFPGGSMLSAKVCFEGK